MKPSSRPVRQEFAPGSLDAAVQRANELKARAQELVKAGKNAYAKGQKGAKRGRGN